MVESKEDTILEEEIGNKLPKEERTGPSKTESYVESNKNTLVIAGVVIIAICSLYFYWQKILIPKAETKAQTAMHAAERHFGNDSLNLALYGHGGDMGMLDIIEEFGSTKSANLAHYYAGISFLKLGNFDQAIEYLSGFSSDDEMIGPIAEGALGDAYSEQGKPKDAASHYKSAANMADNEFTSPMFLLKAGKAYEQLGDYSEAVSLYKKIQQNYPNSDQGKDIIKYITRAEGLDQ